MRTILKVVTVTVVAVVAVALAVQYNIHTYQQPTVSTLDIDCGNRGWAEEPRGEYTEGFELESEGKMFTIYLEKGFEFDQCEIIE